MTIILMMWKKNKTYSNLPIMSEFIYYTKHAWACISRPILRVIPVILWPSS